MKITATFRASRRLRLEDTKRIMSPEKFRDFRETGPGFPPNEADVSNISPTSLTTSEQSLHSL